MSQPMLTEIRHDDGHALVAWPTADVESAVTGLVHLDTAALARVAAAVRDGREGREGPISWRPLPDPTVAVTEALEGAARTLVRHGVDADVACSEGRWALRADAAVVTRSAGRCSLAIGADVITVGAPDRGVAPLTTPLMVRAREERTWACAVSLRSRIAPWVERECQAAVEAAVTTRLARWAAHGQGRVEDDLCVPSVSVWAGLVMWGGRVMGIGRWDAGLGRWGEVRCSVDSLTDQDVARALGVSAAEGRAVRDRGRRREASLRKGLV